MKAQLKAAGIKLPSLKKRVWLWLKDHPGKGCKEVADGLNEKMPGVATQLAQLYTRSMVARSGTPYVYSVLGKEYELVPAVKEKPALPAETVFQPLPLPKTLKDLDPYTVKELRALKELLGRFV